MMEITIFILKIRSKLTERRKKKREKKKCIQEFKKSSILFVFVFNSAKSLIGFWQVILITTPSIKDFLTYSRYVF